MEGMQLQNAVRVKDTNRPKNNAIPEIEPFDGVVPGEIYLTASSAVRAKRRYDELIAKGETPDIDKIEADIITRDKQDMERPIAPLKQADDAVYLDSSDLGIDEVVAKIISIAEK